MSKHTPLAYKVIGIRVGSLFDLYRYRLRNHIAEELLAGAGIAVGVALVFGVLLANTSITSQAGKLVHGVIGTAQFELSARSSLGFSERTAEAAGRIPGVKVASPILREDVIIEGPSGRERAQLIGVTASLAALESQATRNLGAGSLILSGGVGLPSSIAANIGAKAGQSVEVLAGGVRTPISVRGIFGSETIGPVADSPVLVTLLPTAQRLAGLPGKVTEVLVRSMPGRTHSVARELKRLAAGRLDVTAADHELALLDNAAQPVDQSTKLFAAIGAMVGALLALNAMLLTVPDRRRFVAEIRRLGFTARQVVVVLIYQAVVLGALSSILGIGLGYLLSRVLFHEVPLILTFAFPISGHQAVSFAVVLSAIGSGVLAATIAQVPPALDLRTRVTNSGLRQSGEPGQSIGQSTALKLGVFALFLAGLAIGGALLDPGLTILSGILLVLAVLCLAPALIVGAIMALAPISDRLRGSMLPLAITEVRATATRSIVVVGIAGLAVYGSVAMQGARNDLVNGLDSAVTDYLDTADIWVTASNNTLNIDPLRLGSIQSNIASTPGIAAIRAYQGGLLDIGSRRVWLRARAQNTPDMLEPSQLTAGDLSMADRRLRARGWAAVSSALANEMNLHVGSAIYLPTPSGAVRFKVAAVTTNIGWTPGAVTINSDDYRQYWSDTKPTALEILLKPGVSSQKERKIVNDVITEHHLALLAQTVTERETVYRASVRQGLKSLGQISTLLLVASALAIAATLSAAIWQRRAHLATLKAQGFVSRQIWQALLMESAILLMCGSFIGGGLGILGHALATRWLKATTGFPAPFTFGMLEVLLVLAIVTGIALVVIAIPGYLAAKVSPSRRYQW